MEVLIKKLKQYDANEEARKAFAESGMINKYDQVGFGFFPLGKGILTDEPITPSFKIMVLGNDFGTDAYLQKCIDDGRKESGTKSPTIRNLRTKLGLNLPEVFFTNFYLGVRQGGSNTKREVSLKEDFKKLCFDFFLTQLETINPQIVICLGNDVRYALMDVRSDLFNAWGQPRSTALKTLYADNRFYINTNDDQLGKRKFIIIPHPCDDRNFKEEYLTKVKELMQ